MRYYEFEMKMKAEEIKSETVRLKDFSYESNVEALVNYLYRNLTNGVSFLIYNTDNDCLKAVYAVDERKRDSDEAMGEIMATVGYVLGIKVKTTAPVEITMIDFDVKMFEAKRRGLTQYWSRMIDQANNLIWDDRECIVTGRCGFKFDEAVARKGAGTGTAVYLADTSLTDELGRIKKCVSSKKHAEPVGAIPVHYVISAKGMEAGRDITLTLMQALAEAGRLPGGRVELITDIDYDLYKHPATFEKLIENSHGGTIVLDMSGRFGTDPTTYKTTCDYLCKVIKKHRNDNLFVFVYDMDDPGFAFTLLPQIQSFTFLMKIREGKGDAGAAEDYLKHIILNSELAVYADQAGEFLKTMPQKVYTQTDVLRAFENFESWAIRKNCLMAYDIETDAGFRIDRDTDTRDAYEQLQSLTGLTSVKRQVDNIILASKAERQRKKHGGQSRTMHMCFTGNPGSAKTMVAELVARILKQEGILASGAFAVRTGVELNGMFAAFRIHQAFEAAMGGLLFIDEAYALTSDTAVTALIREMETYRNDVIVIFAGYKERMQRFIEVNEGLKSRIPYTVNFPDYNADELVHIYEYILKQDGYSATPGALESARDIFEKACRIEDFGNGRYARNLAEKSTLNMSVRLAKKYGDEIPASKLYKVTKEDVFIPDDSYVNPNDGETRKGEASDGKSAREQLEAMIGLTSAKQVIEKAIATFKMQKRLSKDGIDIGRNAMSMCFTGNPGVAKTTVARLLAQILKDEGVLSSGVFVEAGRGDLVGEFVGQTAPKVKKKFKDANGGVLFIDEAYSLDDGTSRGNFGDEAINTIVQEMENRKDDIIVIFAGYPEEMKRFVDRNPGMSSRIAYRIHFDDYTVKELCEITRYQVAQRHMKITDEAIDKLAPIYEIASRNKTFGNGRYVRKAVELAISNLALRVYKMDESVLTNDILTTITAEDIEAPELDPDTHNSRRIGFVA